MRPESDPSAALTVSRGTETGVSGTTGLSLSQTPSANVSLGLNRNKTLTVEYALKTWSLSAHRISSGTMALSVVPLRLTSCLDAVDIPEGQTMSTEKVANTKLKERPVYQWFWSGTHADTRTLTPDLKHTVKRHVVVKRSIPVTKLRMRGNKVEEVKSPIALSDGSNKAKGDHDANTTDKTGKITAEDEKGKSRASAVPESLHSLDDLLDFSFLIQVSRHLISSTAVQLTCMVRLKSSADSVACIGLLS
jgi:hypothetical protein